MVGSRFCKKLFSLLFPFLVWFQVCSTEPSIASVGSTWINSPPGDHDDIMIEPILSRQIDDGLLYGCGFYCNRSSDTAFLTVFIGRREYIDETYIRLPQVVWSANRNSPVGVNATVQVTADGELVLRDEDGSVSWSTNTSGKGVKGLNLTENGNLVLFDGNSEVVWQSFDHPTDSLVPGQSLVLGQKLIASVSEYDWTEGTYFAEVVTNGLSAYIKSNYTLPYGKILTNDGREESRYVQFENGVLNLFADTKRILDSRGITGGAQYIRLMTDGRLKAHKWADNIFEEVADLTDRRDGDYSNPMDCGVYGIWTKGKCTCPTPSNDSTIFFKRISELDPNMGCSAVKELRCNATQHHRFVDLENVTYITTNFTLIRQISGGIDVDLCKEACLKSCSCKAAVFEYTSDPSAGSCYLPTEAFSFRNNEKDETGYISSTYIKVQISHGRNKVPVIWGSVVGGFFVLSFIIGYATIRKRNNASPAAEDYLDNLPGMPSRLSYDELRTATNNFSTKLGQGGFGSVYKGILKDGTEVAVKCLDGVGQITKSFLAEVQSIGSIHHVNLVRLVGFTAEKSHRLLVYEYMINGSLDRWIYHKTPTAILDFKFRKAIIQDVAKGLAYLHDECRQKILHLDIKPQNILLDGKFNAKLSDFGLSKLIDRDQIQVVTTMRGTPGYLAPEWLSGIITEKVDVYSFGIVVLEILCGRKIFEVIETEDARFLLSLFKIKAMEGQLMDIVDKYSDDMQSHGEEVVKIMKIAAWCL